MNFNPTEIIFAATDACNLHCKHCFVNRTPNKLNIQYSIAFLQSCITSSTQNNNLPRIEKIGFSGGEPFLYLDFIIELTQFAVKNDLLFDQIMTNGDWWKNSQDLHETLQKVYDAGYDGKIGLSWDTFHGQKTERMLTFISEVQNVFGSDSINIQTVLQEGEVSPCASARKLSSATLSAGSNAARNACLEKSIKQYFLPQTFPSNNEKAWKSKKWFKEDYCQGPGNILYIHSNGNIAPCCGFANENSELFIGTIKDSYETVIKNASTNRMIQICYETGLSKYRKQLKKQKNKFPGKCGDICSFCDYICKQNI